MIFKKIIEFVGKKTGILSVLHEQGGKLSATRVTTGAIIVFVLERWTAVGDLTWPMAILAGMAAVGMGLSKMVINK